MCSISRRAKPCVASPFISNWYLEIGCRISQTFGPIYSCQDDCTAIKLQLDSFCARTVLFIVSIWIFDSNRHASVGGRSKKMIKWPITSFRAFLLWRFLSDSMSGFSYRVACNSTSKFAHRRILASEIDAMQRGLTTQYRAGTAFGVRRPGKLTCRQIVTCKAEHERQFSQSRRELLQVSSLA